jgi:hypothetical protein
LLTPGFAAQTTGAISAASVTAGCGQLMPGPDETCPYDEYEGLHSMNGPVAMMECRMGGRGVESCTIRCNEMFGFYYSSCLVECDHEYYACCNCNDGATCHCYLDHMEIWPISPRY